MQQDANNLQNSQERNPEMEINRENPEDPRDHMGQGQELKVRVKYFVVKCVIEANEVNRTRADCCRT